MVKWVDGPWQVPICGVTVITIESNDEVPFEAVKGAKMLSTVAVSAVKPSVVLLLLQK